MFIKVSVIDFIGVCACLHSSFSEAEAWMVPPPQKKKVVGNLFSLRTQAAPLSQQNTADLINRHD